MIQILKPTHGHGGDTFRQLLDMWEENGYCKVLPTDHPNCWVGEVGNILLFDFPRLDDRPIPTFKFALFGNTVPFGDAVSPWIFWGRKPRSIEEHRKDPASFRNIESMFLGKVENHLQLNNRTRVRWDNVVELFSMPVRMGEATNTNYPYTQDQYLNFIKRSKFGLCLPGYGPKCNREIEYMAFGTVPIITPGVDITYYNPIVEGEHFIHVERPDELKEKISSISDDEWDRMSKNCIRWYEENCSPKGSYDITMKILNEANVL